MERYKYKRTAWKGDIWLSVYLVNYEKEEQNVIVKKMKGESAEAMRRFEKEAVILNTVKGQKCV